MKNIKYPLILLVQLFVLQLVAQDNSVLDNGRSANATPAAPAVTENTSAAQTAGDATGEIDDADIPGTYYLRGGSDNDVVYGEDGPVKLLERLDLMEAQLEELRLQNEQLANENQAMKMEMSSCCAEAAAGLNLTGSYLMQNTPNPFQTNTNIKYFVAESAANAVIELRNVDGVLLQSYQINQRGIGEMRLDRRDFSKGSYIYTLTVDGKIVDSKVMILQ